MSRSFQHSRYAVLGNTDKVFKQIWHGKMRTIERDKLVHLQRETKFTLVGPFCDCCTTFGVEENDDYVTTLPKDVSNIYDSKKDHRWYLDRKDIEEYPKYMRK